MPKKKKTKRPLKDRLIMGISISLAIIAVLTVIVLLLYKSSLFTGGNGEIIDQNSNLSPDADNPVGDADNITDKGIKSENILICGLDESGSLTDVIMVVCIDYQKNSVEVLQVPRDTYVASGGGKTGKINAAYTSGDSKLTPINRLIKVINEQYRLKIDHYATITLKSFRNIIDAIGGVPIDLPEAIGNNELGILPAGPQVLDGEHAEWLVRHRKTYVEGDVGRIKAQRLFLAAAVQQLKNIGLNEILNIIPAVFGNFTTDLSLQEVKTYAKTAFNIEMDKIRIHMVPGEGIMYKGQAVWSMHYYETADLLNKYFREYTEKVPAEKLKITELAHTGEYYEATGDDFQGLIDGEKPGQKEDDNDLPTYSHVVTQPPVVTIPPPATTTTPQAEMVYPIFGDSVETTKPPVTTKQTTSPPVTTSPSEIDINHEETTQIITEDDNY